MVRMLVVLVYASAFAFACRAQTPVAPAVDYSKLTNEALVDAMPPAEREISWVHDKSVEHPAAVELRNRIKQKKLSDVDWSRLVVKTGILITREAWPSNRTYAVALVCPTYLGWVSAKPELEKAVEIHTISTKGGCALGNDTVLAERAFMECGKVRAGATEVVFRVLLGTEGSDRLQSRPVWSGQVRVPVRLAASQDEAVRPTSAKDVEDAFREALSILISKNQVTPSTTGMWINFDPLRVTKPPQTRLPIHAQVSLLDGERVLSESKEYFGAWADDGSPSEYARGVGRSTRSVYVTVLLDDRLSDPAFADRLVLRITPDREAAFRDLLSPAYWTGQMEFRVKDLREAASKKGAQRP